MGSTLNAFSLPGVGRVEGREPTRDEYELAVAYMSGRLGGLADLSVALAKLKSTLRRRRWADAMKGIDDGNEDGDQLDGSDVEPYPGLFPG